MWSTSGWQMVQRRVASHQGRAYVLPGPRTEMRSRRRGPSGNLRGGRLRCGGKEREWSREEATSYGEERDESRQGERGVGEGVAGGEARAGAERREMRETLEKNEGRDGKRREDGGDGREREDVIVLGRDERGERRARRARERRRQRQRERSARAGERRASQTFPQIERGQCRSQAQSAH
ncbi:hypothetical protein BD414DRAFT_491704 [Trametes punicea]|nr:hypothetical protein BD414DRAFT_491704 [Trametes punicea]